MTSFFWPDPTSCLALLMTHQVLNLSIDHLIDKAWLDSDLVTSSWLHF